MAAMRVCALRHWFNNSDIGKAVDDCQGVGRVLGERADVSDCKVTAASLKKWLEQALIYEAQRLTFHNCDSARLNIPMVL